MALPDSLAFWLFVPGLFLVLFFGWLVYVGRGKRNTKFEIQGFGVSIAFDSSSAGSKVSDTEKERI